MNISSGLEILKNIQRAQSSFCICWRGDCCIICYEQSHDQESKLSNAPDDVRQYLRNEVGSMLDNDDFIEGVGCHMQIHTTAQKLRKLLISYVSHC